MFPCSADPRFYHVGREILNYQHREADGGGGGDEETPGSPNDVAYSAQLGEVKAELEALVRGRAGRGYITSLLFRYE